MKTILLCEDETPIREMVAINLQRNGYRVLQAASGEEALRLFERFSSEIAIALLDVMLPGIDGFTVCERLRKLSDTIGIIMLTARSQEAEKIGALKLGADDYVTKPFSPSELMARVESLFRRVTHTKLDNTVIEPLISGPFSLDLRTRALRKNESIIELTQVEFQMMQYFFENAGKVVSRSDILKYVWGDSYFGEEKIVDVNIRRLRMKIERDPSEPRHILTVWGRGYEWNI